MKQQHKTLDAAGAMVVEQPTPEGSAGRFRPMPGAWPEDIISEASAAEFTGLSRRTLQTHRYHGTGPKWYSGFHRVGYRLADLEAYIAARDAAPVPVETRPARRPGRPRKATNAVSA